MSHPSARDVPAGADSRRVKSAIVSGRKTELFRIEHGMGKSGKIHGVRKNSRLAGDATQDAGIFVLHFALDDALTEAAIIRRRRNLRADFLRRIESGVGHSERSKDFALAEAVERFIGESLEGDGKEDESNVAVLERAIRDRRRAAW